MLTTNDKYKKAINDNNREIRLNARMVLIEPTAENYSVGSFNESQDNIDVIIPFDLVKEVTKYDLMLNNKNGLVLDGSNRVHTANDYDATTPMVCKATNEKGVHIHSDFYTTLQVRLNSACDLSGITIIFGKNFPSKIKVTYSNNFIVEYEVTGREFVIKEKIEKCTSIYITVLEGEPNTNIVINEVIPAYTVFLNDDTVQRLSSTEEIDRYCSTLPINSLNLEYIDIDGDFDFKNILGIYKSLKIGQKINVRYQVLLDDILEEINVGDYYFKSCKWENGIAKIEATDVIGAYENETVGDFEFAERYTPIQTLLNSSYSFTNLAKKYNLAFKFSENTNYLTCLPPTFCTLREFLSKTSQAIGADIITNSREIEFRHWQDNKTLDFTLLEDNIFNEEFDNSQIVATIPECINNLEVIGDDTKVVYTSKVDEVFKTEIINGVSYNILRINLGNYCMRSIALNKFTFTPAGITDITITQTADGILFKIPSGKPLFTRVSIKGSEKDVRQYKYLRNISNYGICLDIDNDIMVLSSIVDYIRLYNGYTVVIDYLGDLSIQVGDIINIVLDGSVKQIKIIKLENDYEGTLTQKIEGVML